MSIKRKDNPRWKKEFGKDVMEHFKRGVKELTCPNPNCGKRIPLTLDEAVSEDVITCPHCGGDIQLIDKDGSLKKLVEGNF